MTTCILLVSPDTQAAGKGAFLQGLSCFLPPASQGSASPVCTGAAPAASALVNPFLPASLCGGSGPRGQTLSGFRPVAATDSFSLGAREPQELMSESALFCSKRLREAGEPGLQTHVPHLPLVRAGGGAVLGRSCGGRAERFGCREEWGQRARGRRGGTWGLEQSHGGGGSRWRLVYLLSCFVSGSLRETEAAGRRISNWARGPLGLSPQPQVQKPKQNPQRATPGSVASLHLPGVSGPQCQFLPGKQLGSALPAEVRGSYKSGSPMGSALAPPGSCWAHLLCSHLWAGTVLRDPTT